jgi:hypothetical protein
LMPFSLGESTGVDSPLRLLSPSIFTIGILALQGSAPFQPARRFLFPIDSLNSVEVYGSTGRDE